MVLKHCFKSRMQLSSILYVTFSNLSVTDSIWKRADDAYLVGEIYTMKELGVWFFAEKGFLSLGSDF